MVQFEQPTYTVDEDVGQFEVCVVVTMPSQSGLLDSTFNLSLSTIPGSAGTYFVSLTCTLLSEGLILPTCVYLTLN